MYLSRPPRRRRGETVWSKEKRRQRRSDDKHLTPVPTGLAWGATLVVMLVIAASVFILADYLPGIRIALYNPLAIVKSAIKNNIAHALK